MGLAARLFAPIPIGPLALFRIVFGIVIVAQAASWLKPDPSTGRSLALNHYGGGRFLFKYFGFDWVRPWPDDLVEWHVRIIGLAGALVALGLAYRIAAVVTFVAITHFFLLDALAYVNHIYLLCLLAFLMIFLPAHRALSLDSWWRPKLRCSTAPAWTLWLLRFQVGIPYFFGGLAKLNADWLAGEPVRTWLHRRMDLPVVGPFLGNEIAVHVVAYGGLLLDLFALPLLLWRRTRIAAMVVCAAFHLSNATLFNIGVFPWLMLGSTVLFLDPAWLAALRSPGERREPSEESSAIRRRVALVALAAYGAVQLALPLRHWLYPGDVNFTYEGSRFAWRMKLHDRRAKVVFNLTDGGTGEVWAMDFSKVASPGVVNKVGARPDLVLQLAHELARQQSRLGVEAIEVRGDVRLSINGRPYEPSIDPSVDLVPIRDSAWPARWILRPSLEPLTGGGGASSGEEREAPDADPE